MITEDHVSIETAKLLAQKGFNESCDYCYVEEISSDNSSFHLSNINDLLYNEENDLKNVDLSGWVCLAPTLQMAMKWLRNVHGLHCNSDYDFVLGWYCQITSLNETVEYDYEEMKHYHPDKDSGFSSPEEACEAAIKYCLENLI